jgi:ribosome biogenesis GTPase / thiamine phosphate phosphatase
MPKALLIKQISNRYTLLDENHQRLIAVAAGKMKLKASPMVGDWIEYQIKDDQVVMQSFEKRRTVLRRPVIANVDQALIVMSARKPDFSTQLVDRFVWLIKNAGIRPVLIVTKMDLINEDDPIHIALNQYEKEGLSIIRVYRGQEIIGLEDVIAQKISVLTGQSGVGKSTLLNRLNPEFVLHTQEISKALGRGKHTTRHVELYEVAQGWVADTPGFSSLEFNTIPLDQLSYLVSAFDPYRDHCHFRNCLHINEPKCAIKQAVQDHKIDADRYQHYTEVVQLIQNTKEIYL